MFKPAEMKRPRSSRQKGKMNDVDYIDYSYQSKRPTHRPQFLSNLSLALPHTARNICGSSRHKSLWKALPLNENDFALKKPETLEKIVLYDTRLS